MNHQPDTSPRQLFATVLSRGSAGLRASPRRLLALCLAGAALALVAGPGHAELISAFNDPDLFGRLKQQEVGSLGESACGPTSVVNSFVYLQNKYPAIYGKTLVPDGTDPADTALVLTGESYMNTTAEDGTQDGYMAYGKQKYMEEQAHGVTTYRAVSGDADWDGPAGQQPDWFMLNTVPTIDFLYTALAGAFDVEVGVTWTNPGEEGGHWITAYGLSFDTVQQEGTLFFLDPWDAVLLEGSLSMMDGKLQLAYTGGAAENDWLTSSIDIVIAEGIPEPAILLLLGSGGLTLLVLRRRRKT